MNILIVPEMAAKIIALATDSNLPTPEKIAGMATHDNFKTVYPMESRIWVEDAIAYNEAYEVLQFLADKLQQ